ncbi:MAG TPA: transcription termination/antitermination NusG family protein [Gemmataceae bacterium]|jgi:transcriptional antiterminator NusG|nr:transcription termination/antitermination NusG family protein [Gemmataceae bacterium]
MNEEPEANSMPEESVPSPEAPSTPAPVEADAPAAAAPAETAGAVATAAAPAAPSKKWYVVKVQSGREDSIRGNLERRIKLENLEQYVGRVVVPVEKITEVRDGKRRIKKVKKFPGYLFCEVEFNEHVLYLFRETSGVGDFVGGTGTGPNKLPQPMTDREVQRMLADQDELAPDGKPIKKDEEEVTTGKGRIKLDYDVGDTVKVREGMFANMEGPVTEIADRDSQSPKVKVTLTIWGRPVPVDLDYWQVDRV